MIFSQWLFSLKVITKLNRIWFPAKLQRIMLRSSCNKNKILSKRLQTFLVKITWVLGILALNVYQNVSLRFRRIWVYELLRLLKVYDPNYFIQSVSFHFDIVVAKYCTCYIRFINSWMLMISELYNMIILGNIFSNVFLIPVMIHSAENHHNEILALLRGGIRRTVAFQ